MRQYSYRDLKAVASAVTTNGAGADMEMATNAEALRLGSKTWLEEQHVQGVGIGYRIRDGERQDHLALKVYVSRKLPKTKVKNPVPKRLRSPISGTPVSTDVEEVGIFEVQGNTSRRRPAQPGYSIGVRSGPSGTIGCLVEMDADPGGTYLLGNSHILAGSGRFAPGRAIYQPGPWDTTPRSENRIGELAKATWIDFTNIGFPNEADAAIARVEKPESVSPRIRLLGVPMGVSNTLRIGMYVQKVGRTTDYTEARIVDTHASVRVRYPQGTAGFSNTVLCQPLTKHGDSGAAVLDRKRQVVGLHFAGSDSASLFCPIDRVQKSLGISVVVFQQ